MSVNKTERNYGRGVYTTDSHLMASYSGCYHSSRTCYDGGQIAITPVITANASTSTTALIPVVYLSATCMYPDVHAYSWKVQYVNVHIHSISTDK
jgi:hypothetical protein